MSITRREILSPRTRGPFADKKIVPLAGALVPLTRILDPLARSPASVTDARDPLAETLAPVVRSFIPPPRSCAPATDALDPPILQGDAGPRTSRHAIDARGPLIGPTDKVIGALLLATELLVRAQIVLLR